MAGLKVLIVDDSLLFRETIAKQLGEYLPAGSEIDKADGPFAARDKIMTFRPDVMLLDVEMPKMNGIEFLKRLLSQYPLPTVIMSSEPVYCSKALLAGASDFISKPYGGRTVDEVFLTEVALRLRVASMRQITIRNYDWRNSGDSDASAKPGDAPEKPAQRPRPQPKAAEAPKVPPKATAPEAPSKDGAKRDGAPKEDTGDKKEADAGQKSLSDSVNEMFVASYNLKDESPPGKRRRTLIAIGASTGGTIALTKVMGGLEPPLPPIVVVQHMPANFSRMFAERLNEESKLTVKEAQDGDRLRANTVYIAPGGKHMRLKCTLAGTRLECAPGKPVNSVCPAVDVLFDTVAEYVGEGAIGVILTGMGRDGADGLYKMRKAGAVTIGQDERTCVVYGMPRAAYEVGAVQRQLPLDAIASNIMSVAREYY